MTMATINGQLNPAALAWQDALSGNMTFRGDRSKYGQFGPVEGQNPIMSGIRQLLNETLLMPQNATAGWVNAFGPPPGTAGLIPKPPAGPAPNLMPNGAAIPNPSPIAPRAMRTQTTRPGTALSVPVAQEPDYWTMVNGLEGTSKNPKSSAVGPGQFTDGTFNDYLKSTGKKLGADGVPADLTEAKKALGQDATMWYKEMNAKQLGTAGVPVNNTTLYGAHFLGPGGLTKVWQADPNTPVNQVLDADAISSNPTILAGKTAGQVKAWLEAKTSGNVLPVPPTMDAPPQAGAPKNLDFTQANSFFDAGKPKPIDQGAYDSQNLSAVLGGLAGGAASVDVTKPGALAATIAAMGAGGQQGMTASTNSRIAATTAKDDKESQFAMNRGNIAQTQMTAQHQVEDQQNQVAFTNAKSVWDVAQKNKETQYEGTMKERAARMPKITSDANGFMVQQYNPATQSMDIKYTPTKDIFANAEKSTELIKALGAPGPASEAMLVPHILQTVQDPVIAQAVLEKEAIRRTIQGGGGTTVFGKAYDAAYKAAEARVPAALQKEPLEYQKAVQEMAASDIYNALAKKGDRSWLKAAAANGSIIAGILGGAGPQ